MKSLGIAFGVLGLLVLGWRAAEWMGVALVLGGVMMWLLLHFTRLMIVLQRAARHPIGSVESAVMLNAALKRGLSLVQVMAHTHALGAQDSPKGFIAFGEVGLAGEVRPAPRGQDRLKEAAKLGFSVAVVPKANAPKKAIEGLTVHGVERIEDAMALVRELG